MNKKYLIKERWGKDKSRHAVSLWLCKCGKTIKRRFKRSPLICTSCWELPTRFNSLAAFNHIYCRYKASAWERCLGFDISLAQFINVALNKCTYCDSDYSNRYKTKHGELRYNGLDRIDSSQGYHVSNITSCCRTCNTSKNDLTLKEWKEWIDKVYERKSKWEEEKILGLNPETSSHI